MNEESRVMMILDAVLACDCDVDEMMSNHNDEDVDARYAACADDPPVFDSSMWAAFGA